jgi:hypothetical protein
LVSGRVPGMWLPSPLRVMAGMPRSRMLSPPAVAPAYAAGVGSIASLVMRATWLARWVAVRCRVRQRGLVKGALMQSGLWRI